MHNMENVEGECNAQLHIADDYGDNHATMRCQLPKDHTGAHREAYSSLVGGQVVVMWEKDERTDGDQQP